MTSPRTQAMDRVGDRELLEAAAWKQGRCRVAMWMGGLPAGLCGEAAYGHQLPERVLWATRSMLHVPLCVGHCCPKHGGPQADEPRIFADGYTPEGRRMWCAVMPDFINLQESPAGFSGDPLIALANLRAAASLAPLTGENLGSN